MTETLNNCPVCQGTSFSGYLEVRDHFLSKELFTICRCNDCGFRFINPRPDRNEIGKYYQSDEYISHGVQKSDLVSRVYSVVRKFSIKNKYHIVSAYCRTGRILDIGCGTGEFLEYCRKKGHTVAGVEPSEKARAIVRTEKGIEVTGELESLEDRPGHFDCITMWHVLEHVHDLNKTLVTIKSLLKPEGVFVVAVPNSNSWDAEKYGTYWAAYDVPRHLYHFTKSSLETLALKNGFHVLKTVPQKLDAYYISMLSEKYLKGKINYVRSSFRGFLSNRMAKNKGRGHSSLILILSTRKA